MKKFFLALIAILCIAAPKVLKAQPWSEGMNAVMKADNFVSTTGFFSSTGPMIYPKEAGYDFDDVGIDYMERKNKTGNGEYSMLHVYSDSQTSFSLYTRKMMKSTEAVSLFQLYIDWRAKEILHDFFYESRKIIIDTVTSGSLWLGTKENPKDQRFVITSGIIIVSYDTQTNRLTFTAEKVMVEDESGFNAPFVFPEPKL